MARKQLIKGANAARVEARISRVPVDLGSGLDAAPSIFGALKAMEADAQVPKPKASAPTPARPLPKPKAPAKSPAKPKAERRAEPKVETKAEPEAATPARLETEAIDSPQRAADIIPIEPEAPLQPKPGRIGPSDFTAVEREAILRCCKDYRNHLPTYLLAVQREVMIIDSVIEKCQAAGTGRSKR
jgi:hypothetical protein